MIKDNQRWNIKKNGSMICFILDWYCLDNGDLVKPIRFVSLDHVQRLCYLCDFNRFEETDERSITGETYVHGDNGPVPIHFEETVKKLITFDKVRLFDSSHLSIEEHPLSKLAGSNISPYGRILSSEDEESIRKTLTLYGHESEEAVETMLKDDTPWLLSGYCQALDYGYASFRMTKQI